MKENHSPFTAAIRKLAYLTCNLPPILQKIILKSTERKPGSATSSWPYLVLFPIMVKKKKSSMVLKQQERARARDDKVSSNTRAER